ncbi:MAG: hypothetical protein KC416_03295, partial [Myxococcales bacterium]|nr:hypothetical protein [Myxococcales bacterium]
MTADPHGAGPSSVLRVYSTHRRVAAESLAGALAAPQGVVLGNDALTLDELASAMVFAALPDIKPLDRMERSLLLQDAVIGAEGRGPGDVPDRRTRAFLARAVDLLIEAGVDSETIVDSLARFPPATRHRLDRLGALLRVYERAQGRMGRVDPRLAEWQAVLAVREGAALPPQVQEATGISVHLEGPVRPAVLALLEGLAQRLAPGAEVVLHLPYTEGSPFWSSGLRVLDNLEARGEGSALTVFPFDPSDGIGVGPRLLRAGYGDGKDPFEPITFVHAPSPMTQYAAVARMLRERIQGGVPPDRVAVMAPDMAARRGMLETCLQDAGVPVDGTGEGPLAQVPPVRWFLSILALGADGMDRDRVLHILESRYARSWFPRCQDHVRHLRRLALRAGSPDDGTALSDALAALAGREGADEAAVAATVECLEALRQAVAPLAKAATLPEYLKCVRSLFQRVGLEDVVLLHGSPPPHLATLLTAGDGSEDPLARWEARGVGQDLVAVSTLSAALEDLAARAEALHLDTVLSPQVLLETVSAELGDRVIRSGHKTPGVTLLDLGAAAGATFDTVALVDLEANLVPRTVRENPHFRSVDRWLLGRLLEREARLGVRPVHDGAAFLAAEEEREWSKVGAAFVAAGERLILAASRTNARGKPVAPSPLVDQFRFAGGLTVEGGGVRRSEPLARAWGSSEVRRALAVLAIEGVDPSLAFGVLPGLEEVVRRATVERGRLATILAPGTVDADAGAVPGADAVAPDPSRGGADSPL